MKVYIVEKLEFNGYECDGVETYAAIFMNALDAVMYKDEQTEKLREYEKWLWDLPIVEYDIDAKTKEWLVTNE